MLQRTVALRKKAAWVHPALTHLAAECHSIHNGAAGAGAGVCGTRTPPCLLLLRETGLRRLAAPRPTYHSKRVKMEPGAVKKASR